MIRGMSGSKRLTGGTSPRGLTASKSSGLTSLRRSPRSVPPMSTSRCRARHERRTLRTTFDTWLAGRARLLIEGNAGSGKTTLLQWAAVRAALRDFADPVAYLNGKIPFFLHLRAYADRELPKLEDFLGSIAPLLAGEAPAGGTSSNSAPGERCSSWTGPMRCPIISASRSRSGCAT